MLAIDAQPLLHIKPISRVWRRAVRNVFEDVADLSRRLQRDRKRTVELRPVPVHLRRRQRFPQQEIPVRRVAAPRVQHQRVGDVEAGIAGHPSA